MHIRCPHCHHSIEVDGDSAFDDVTCPSCGSNISLVSDQTTEAYEPGPKQLGHFELLERIGLGAFGAVWKARDTVLQRIVALKVPRRGQLESSEVEFFFRDARAAAQLRHPSIVSVHEVGRDGDTVFIASDYIEGATLHEWISAKPLTLQESAELVAYIAEAVQHAHERGVVHRDLKPGNILMDATGRPHITDFGLAKRDVGEITMTLDGQILGTPAYMSPEQARGKAHEATATSDVYSLGVILYELLTGELPFRGEKRMLILQILNDEPPSPRKLNGRIPRDLETIALKAMAKEPGRRYAKAQDIADDLKRWMGGQAILARPVGRIERVWRWGKRNPLVAALMGAVIASLAAGALVSAAFAVKAEQGKEQALTEWRRAEGEKTRAEGEKARADRRAAEALTRQREAEEARERANRALLIIEEMASLDELNEAATFDPQPLIAYLFNHEAPTPKPPKQPAPKQLGSRLHVILDLRLAEMADASGDHDKASARYAAAVEHLEDVQTESQQASSIEFFMIARSFALVAKAFARSIPDDKLQQSLAARQPQQDGYFAFFKSKLGLFDDAASIKRARAKITKDAATRASKCLRMTLELVNGDMEKGMLQAFFVNPDSPIPEEFSALGDDPSLKALREGAAPPEPSR